MINGLSLTASVFVLYGFLIGLFLLLLLCLGLELDRLEDLPDLLLVVTPLRLIQSEGGYTNVYCLSKELVHPKNLGKQRNIFK